VGNSWRVYPQPLAWGKGLPRVEKADPYPYPSIPYPKPMRVFKPLTITNHLVILRVPSHDHSTSRDLVISSRASRTQFALLLVYFARLDLVVRPHETPELLTFGCLLGFVTRLPQATRVTVYGVRLYCLRPYTVWFWRLDGTDTGTVGCHRTLSYRSHKTPFGYD
jgi:hypothetical protein